jgi:hypothetical protein
MKTFANNTCPCCGRPRNGTHTPAEKARCSAWARDNLASAKPSRRRAYSDKDTAHAIRHFTQGDR